jgi:adenylate cyclase
LTEAFNTTGQLPAHACVLFVDISDSTKIYETLGDKIALHITQNCLHKLIMLAMNYQGRVIKTIGDEVMCQFTDVCDASLAAVNMQEYVDQEPPTEGVKLSIRIGFHYGDVIEEGGDLFGDTVNTAARVIAEARRGQILTTGASRELLLEEMPEQLTRWVKSAWLKGKTGTTDVYEVVWEDENDRTMALSDTSSLRLCETSISKMSHEMLVCFAGQEVIVGQKNTCINIGRSRKNDLMTKTGVASREHARIEFRPPNYFVVVDQSTNGSTVYVGKREYRLLHDEVMVHQSGKITIGSGKEQDVIEFNLREIEI